MSASLLAGQVERLCREAARDLPSEHASTLDATLARLRGPVRVAIAGRVKAGKSTLLNALIGERLAPTDAGERTTIVTWYRHAPSYEVTVVIDGAARAPRFRKGEEAIEIELPADTRIDRIEIGCPSRRLEEATFIDTPGLGSLSAETAAATTGALGLDGPGPGQADAVVYLMRHAHTEDMLFLEGLRESGLPSASPVHTIGVLSRSDEIGGGRPGAADSARRIAARYMTDARVRGLVSTIVPVTGLLAETGVTLEESEFAGVRQLAGVPAVDDLLLSVDRFRDPERSPLAAELRERALARFGLFGLRFAVSSVREGRATTSRELANLLLDVSGINELRRLVQEQFTRRGKLLVARSALAEVRLLADRLRETSPSAASRLAAAVEEIAASALELAQLDVLHQVAAGEVAFTPLEAMETERLASTGSVASRLNLDPAEPPEVQEQVSLHAIERWRRRAADPLADRTTAFACEVMARSYERAYAEVRAARS